MINRFREQEMEIEEWVQEIQGNTSKLPDGYAQTSSSSSSLIICTSIHTMIIHSPLNGLICHLLFEVFFHNP
jgi:hypothetical protein